MVAFICNQRVCNLVPRKREPISSDGAVVTKQMSAQKNQSFDWTVENKRKSIIFA